MSRGQEDRDQQDGGRGLAARAGGRREGGNGRLPAPGSSISPNRNPRCRPRSLTFSISQLKPCVPNPPGRPAFRIEQEIQLALSKLALDQIPWLTMVGSGPLAEMVEGVADAATAVVKVYRGSDHSAAYQTRSPS